MKNLLTPIFQLATKNQALPSIPLRVINMPIATSRAVSPQHHAVSRATNAIEKVDVSNDVERTVAKSGDETRITV